MSVVSKNNSIENSESPLVRRSSFVNPHEQSLKDSPLIRRGSFVSVQEQSLKESAFANIINTSNYGNEESFIDPDSASPEKSQRPKPSDADYTDGFLIDTEEKKSENQKSLRSGISRSERRVSRRSSRMDNSLNMKNLISGIQQEKDNDKNSVSDEKMKQFAGQNKGGVDGKQRNLKKKNTKKDADDSNDVDSKAENRKQVSRIIEEDDEGPATARRSEKKHLAEISKSSSDDYEEKPSSFYNTKEFSQKVNRSVTRKGILGVLEKERMFKLRKIKQEHRPINAKAINKHQKSFLQKITSNKEKGRQQLREKVIEQEKTYKEQNIYKSKIYDNVIDNFSKGNPFDIQKQKIIDSKIFSEKFAKDVVTKRLPPKEERESNLLMKFPNKGSEHYKWFYGRFGNQEWSKSVDYGHRANYWQKNHDLGNSYMKDSMPITEQQKCTIKLKRTEKQDELAKMTNTKSVEKIDYLRLLREQRKTFGALGKHIMSRSVDVKDGYQDSLPNQKGFGSNGIEYSFYNPQSSDAILDVNSKKETKKLITRITKFDDLVKKKENRLRNKAYSTFVSEHKIIVPDTLDKYYLKSIHAKLSLLGNFDD